MIGSGRFKLYVEKCQKGLVSGLAACEQPLTIGVEMNDKLTPRRGTNMSSTVWGSFGVI